MRATPSRTLGTTASLIGRVLAEQHAPRGRQPQYLGLGECSTRQVIALKRQTIEVVQALVDASSQCRRQVFMHLSATREN